MKKSYHKEIEMKTNWTKRRLVCPSCTNWMFFDDSTNKGSYYCSGWLSYHESIQDKIQDHLLDPFRETINNIKVK